jgi:hypothetical protein
MITRHDLGSEYIIVPANNINNWRTSSRGTIFTWGSGKEQSEVSDIPSRDRI